MSTVVERGLARCPRCVTVADYVFIESETEGMRYEVHCQKCGQRYGERSVPWTPPPRTAEAPMQWPPDCEPVATGDWRNELLQRLFASARDVRTGFEVLGSYAQMMFEKARTQLRARRNGGENQTGG